MLNLTFGSLITTLIWLEKPMPKKEKTYVGHELKLASTWSFSLCPHLSLPASIKEHTESFKPQTKFYLEKNELSNCIILILPSPCKTVALFLLPTPFCCLPDFALTLGSQLIPTLLLFFPLFLWGVPQANTISCYSTHPHILSHSLCAKTHENNLKNCK